MRSCESCNHSSTCLVLTSPFVRVSAKRKRSTSIMSDHLLAGTTNEKLAETPVTAQVDLASLLPPPAPPTGGKSRVRRGGGRKNAATDVSVNGEGEEGELLPFLRPTSSQYANAPVRFSTEKTPESIHVQRQTGRECTASTRSSDPSWSEPIERHFSRSWNASKRE